MTSNTISGSVVAQYFGFFNGVPREHYEHIVETAPFDECNLLILAFVHAVEHNGVYVADFTNWRDGGNNPPEPGDTDSDRVRLVVSTARAMNPDIKILISLGWGGNDAANAAANPMEFAHSVGQLVETYDLNGFDIDFESTEVTAEAMLALARALDSILEASDPASGMITTITPAQTEGLDQAVLGAFTYTLPQSYKTGGNGTTVTWYEEQLGSFRRIVYGLNSEGRDDPAPYAAQAKDNNAAGLFAWRLDNDSVSGSYPTFAIGREMWRLMRLEDKTAT